MKKIFFIALSLATVASMTSCNDWLNEETPGTTKLSDYFTDGSETSAEKIANACYSPMAWEYNAAGTYFAEWFIGDIASDDALKGGQNIGDMSDAYDIENFKVNANNQLLLDFYRAQYIGVARCNLAISQLPEMSGDSISSDVRARLIAEAQFLRAYYYFRLVRVFGGVPLVDFVVDSSEKWNQPRASVADCYAFIEADLEAAIPSLPKKSEYADEDMGRITKGAAQAMLARVALYNKEYDKAKKWAAEVISSGEYSLCPDYADNFTLAGENGQESVFEVQYMDDDMSDYGDANYGGYGYTRGSFTQILTRSRSSQLGGGWGFNKPTQNLYDEFEPTDPRRDEAILNPTDDQIETSAQEIYLGDRYLSLKYSWHEGSVESGLSFPKLSHQTRGPLNYKIIRYSDVLLIYAEACCESGDQANAVSALNQVRQRVGLDDFPYTATIQGKQTTFSNTQADLRTAIRHERRVELAMEGQRWFDLCRWGVVKQVMDAYMAAESDEAKAEMSPFVENKNELFPIPTKELELCGFEQNPNY